MLRGKSVVLFKMSVVFFSMSVVIEHGAVALRHDALVRCPVASSPLARAQTKLG